MAKRTVTVRDGAGNEYTFERYVPSCQFGGCERRVFENKAYCWWHRKDMTLGAGDVDLTMQENTEMDMERIQVVETINYDGDESDYHFLIGEGEEDVIPKILDHRVPEPAPENINFDDLHDYKRLDPDKQHDNVNHLGPMAKCIDEVGNDIVSGETSTFSVDADLSREEYEAVIMELRKYSDEYPEVTH